MRQVPKNKKYTYLFVGNGKVSRHFQFYFNSLNIPHKVWTRNSTKSFEDLADKAEKILVLIKDDEIKNFINSKKKLNFAEKTFIHFSGILSLPQAESAHPLMTFDNDLYDFEVYKKIIFITEKGRKNFHELFPELPNKFYQISPEQKPLYHALCVMSGNFTTILWKIFFDYLSLVNIPREAGYNYLKKITDNIINSENPLTGPIQREDIKTISKHINAIEDQSFKNIYLSFIEFYNPKLLEKINAKCK